VLEPSPDRVTPPCPSRRAGCGGCGWQHLTLDAQRAARVAVVADALRRTGGLPEPLVAGGGGVDPDGYRTTVRVAATADGRAGYRAEGSHEVIPAPQCLIADPALRALLPTLRLDPGVEPTLRRSVATGELAARWDRKAGSVHGLPAGTAVGSDAVLHEDVAGHRLRVSMGSFFQSGPQAAALLVEAVTLAAPELAHAGTVVDAYAGVGMFSLCAADPDSRIVAIETSRSAVVDARHNLADRDADVVRGEVGGFRAPANTAVDVVIADPARSGLGKPGVGALARLGAPVLVLVSCDPASLGRDAKLLAQVGYRHERSAVVDTFPHTTHIEAVSRFTRTAR
jgi:23S rRNA (uracil1939-C5)-methyltransferase